MSSSLFRTPSLLSTAPSSSSFLISRTPTVPLVNGLCSSGRSFLTSSFDFFSKLYFSNCKTAVKEDKGFMIWWAEQCGDTVCEFERNYVTITTEDATFIYNMYKKHLVKYDHDLSTVVSKVKTELWTSDLPSTTFKCMCDEIMQFDWKPQHSRWFCQHTNIVSTLYSTMLISGTKIILVYYQWL